MTLILKITFQVNKILTLLLLSIFSNVCLGQYEVYISSGTGAGSAIKKYDATGAFLGNFITPTSSACNINWTQDILINPYDCTFLISSFNTNQILKFNPATGECLGVFANVPGVPTRMKIGADNLLYVLQWLGNGKVLRYNLDGTFLGEFTNVGVTNSIGIDWDVTGNLYISSFNGNYVRKFSTTGADLGLFINTNLQGPTNIWFNGVGELFVLDWTGNRIKKFSSTGTFLGNIGPVILNPEGVAFLPNGDFLVGYGGTAGKINQYTSTGTLINLFTIGNGLSFPNGIYIKDLSSSNLVTNENDFELGSLRTVLACSGTGDTISVDQSMVDTMQIESTLAISKDITVMGPGVISLNNNAGININVSATTNFENLVIKDKNNNVSTPTIQVFQNLLFKNCEIRGSNFIPKITVNSGAHMEWLGVNGIKQN